MNDSDGMKCEKCGQFRSFLITVHSIDNWKKTRHFDTDWCMKCIWDITNKELLEKKNE